MRWLRSLPSRTSALIYFLPGNVGAGIGSTAMTIPLCVLVGAALAWGAERLERTELALAHECFVADRLRALDEMKDAFMSAISHELRTPITISRGHLEVLEGQPTSDELRAAIDVVLATLISTGDVGFLRLEPVDVGRFANQIGVKAAPLLGDRPLIIDDVSADGVVKADPHRLAQALLNLISNAGRHGTGDGAIRLRIKDEPRWWRFEVADAGGGVPTQLLPTLFEPFRHGPASTGTGLGLAIVRGIAEAHDGQAGVDNDPGRGATFWIRLPR